MPRSPRRSPVAARGCLVRRAGRAPRVERPRDGRRLRAWADPRQVRHSGPSAGGCRASRPSTPRVRGRHPHTVPASRARGQHVRGIERLRARRDVAWAVPDYRAHAAGGLIPNDRGDGAAPGDWQQLQWNFAGPFGVNAPQAWANVAADGAPGRQGVVVAVLDTGVAYANRGHFRRSPDLSRYGFVGGYDFIAHNRFPQRPQRPRHVRRRHDRRGHGQSLRRHRPGLRRAHHAGARARQPGRRRSVDDRRRRALRRPARRSCDQPEPRVLEQRDRLRHPRADRSPALRPPPWGARGRRGRQRGAHRDRLSGARARRGRGRRHHRTRLPGRLLQRRQRAHARRPRRRRRREPSRRSELPPRTARRARHLPGDLHRRLPSPLRPALGLRRNLDGSSPRVRDRRADHRQRRDRPPPDARADHRAPARHRAQAGRGGDEGLYGAGLVDAAAATAPGGPGAVAR